MRSNVRLSVMIGINAPKLPRVPESRKFYLLYRKSWSLEMMVTLDFTSEVKVWLFCA